MVSAAYHASGFANLPDMSSKQNSKRPENTAFKQQRLRSWQPLLTPKSVIPAFFIIGLIFIPLGLVLKIASDQVVEVVLDYTTCISQPNTFQTAPADTGIKEWKYDSATKLCTIRFDVPRNITGPVYLYYRLTNFYQNNRKYVKSFDLPQLQGQAVFDLAPECDPLGKVNQQVTFTIDGKQVQSQTGAVYYPCGLIANSLFSDVISRKLNCINSDYEYPNGGVCKPGSSKTVEYEFAGEKLSWPGDKDKYGNSKYRDLPNLTQMVIPPPFWMQAFDQWKNGYNATNLPNLSQWEDFQVWMRTAGLPTFRKLYGNSGNLLPHGTWEITVKQNYATNLYGGTKALVISNTSILGGKNSFLGASYLVVGTVCVILAVAFLSRHVMKPRILGDHRLLSWNEASKNEQSSLLAQ